MALVAGSYERFIWGFSLKTLEPTAGGADTGDGCGCALKPLFSYPSHTSSIKCVAVSVPIAVSGGADDAVKIYDLSSCSEIGSLTYQGGAVPAVAFYTPPAISFPRNLVTGSDGGVVSIYDADPFVHLKSVRRVYRRGASVGDLAVHPSGRLALTVGRGDPSLAMVNLVRGRRSFICRLDKEASVVRYSAEGGDLFFVAAQERVSVHNSEDAREVAELVGGEESPLCCSRPGSSQRRKLRRGLRCPPSSGFGGDRRRHRVWDARVVSGERPPPHVAELKTKSRLTYLAGSSIKS